MLQSTYLYVLWLVISPRKEITMKGKEKSLSETNPSAPSRPILGQSLERMLPYPSALSWYRARRRYLREASLAAGLPS